MGGLEGRDCQFADYDESTNQCSRSIWGCGSVRRCFRASFAEGFALGIAPGQKGD